MSKRVIKYQSFGAPFEERNKEYTCLKEWPNDISLQCGDKGIVLKKKGGGYATAFFEVLTKDDFIRGEGEDLIKAEEKAFEKLMKIKNCHEHKYERKGDSVDAECYLCNHKEKKYFPPAGKCSTCGKEHTALNINKENFCIQHYIDKSKTINLVINEDIIDKIKQEVFDKINNEKNNEKNIIELMMTKGDNFKSYKDIPDDDYRVEMKVDEIISISENVNIFETLTKLGIKDKFEEEYKFINYVSELEDVNYMSCCSRALETVKKMIKLMVENNLIKGEVDEINYQYNLGDKKIVDNLIEFFKVYLMSLKLEKDYNIKNEDFVMKLTQKTLEENQNDIMNNLTNDITKFYNENKTKINFKRKLSPNNK